MIMENIIEYASVAGAVTLLVVKRKGMKKYIPVALFAIAWGVAWNEFAEYFHWWAFPSRVIFYFDTISATATFVVVPIMAMFWVRSAPSDIRRLLLWSLLGASVLTGFEYMVERYTKLLVYGASYHWYYSFILWFVSSLAWYGFHRWFYKGIREL